MNSTENVQTMYPNITIVTSKSLRQKNSALKKTIMLYRLVIVLLMLVFAIIVVSLQQTINEKNIIIDNLSTTSPENNFILPDINKAPENLSAMIPTIGNIPDEDKNDIKPMGPTISTELENNDVINEEAIFDEVPTIPTTPTVPPLSLSKPEADTSAWTLPEMYNYIPLDTKLKEYIYQSAVDAGIPPEILFSLAWKETLFKPNAVSKTNDHGLFQMNTINFPRFAKIYGCTEEEFAKMIYDPYISTDCTIRILVELRDKYSNDDWHQVLMRYNLGPTGASRKFKQGIYTTKYTRAIMEYAETNFGFTDIMLKKPEA